MLELLVGFLLGKAMTGQAPNHRHQWEPYEFEQVRCSICGETDDAVGHVGGG